MTFSQHEYDLGLVLLSYVVAGIASFTALELARRVTQSHGTSARWWLAAGACSMGTGIWSMHFIGMLAYDPHMAVSYDVPVTLLSLIVAIISSAFALYISSRSEVTTQRLGVSGVAMGAGIAAMHYTGMAAMRMDAALRYDPTLFTLSILIAVVVAAVALYLFFKFASHTEEVRFFYKVTAAMVMGLAICGMHYTGMEAAYYVADTPMVHASVTSTDNLWLATSLGIATLIILGSTLLVLFFDRRLSIQTELGRYLERQLSHEAAHDALTGLINRREFESYLRAALESTRTENHEHALLYLDLDQFKVINDACGHVAGDALLKHLSEVLCETVRGAGVVARLGGDEFGILLHRCSRSQAKNTAEMLRKRVEDFRFTWENRTFTLGASIGLTVINDASQDLSQILKAADSACYLAKESGRNTVRVYQENDELLARRSSEMEWVTRLRRGFEENRFVLHYQPIKSLRNKRGRHVEILLHFQDERGEVLPPMSFIPAGERYGMMPAIDRWVVANMFDLLSRKHVFGPSLRTCAINLSGQSLGEDSFLEFVMQQLQKSRIDPCTICFEITETAAIGNWARATTFINTLRGRGCRFALDDFGSGLSSFAYLKNLSVDYLKIDGSFIKGVVESELDEAIVLAICDIARILGADTIAESVENEQVMRKLQEIGVDFAQGYHIAKPRRLSEVTPADFFRVRSRRVAPGKRQIRVVRDRPRSKPSSRLH